MVHFAPEAHNPVFVQGYKSFWVQFGDIKNMSPLQIKRFIGPGTSGGGENGARFQTGISDIQTVLARWLSRFR